MITLTTRTRRCLFVLKAPLLTLFTMVFVVNFLDDFLQRKRPNREYEFKKTLLRHEIYPLLHFTAIPFWAFLFIIFFRNYIFKLYWWAQILLKVVMAWFNFPILLLPLLSAKQQEWYIAGAITVAIMIFHVVLAFKKKRFYAFDTEYLIRRSVLGFVFTSFGIVLSISWKSSHIDVIVALFMLIYYSTVVVLVARTIGADEFYENEIRSRECLFIILIHYNFIAVFALILLALCKTRCILAST